MTDQPEFEVGRKQWESERKFFDDLAAKAPDFQLDKVSARYDAAMAAPLFPLEAAYALMGDVRGKRVLDVGCGNGENSLLFARWQAEVTGVDISAGSIAVCKQRAKMNGIGANATFIETPFELVSKNQAPYDIIWSAAFLHHVLDRLDEVAKIFESLLKPDGFVLFLEPVRFSPILKKIRRFIPPFPEATPDERPLERSDIAVLEQTFEIVDRRLFGPVSRIADRWGAQVLYEQATPAQKRRANNMMKLDREVMRLRCFESTAMIMVAKLRLRRN